jgi:DNA-binding GntR family transcriptional regulator
MQSSTIAPVEFKTREQATYESIRRAIVEGRLGQGERLVVSRIAIDLGVSRITVANALKRLAGEGFVHLAPHKEGMVAPLDARAVREIYLMRADLEALAAREAAAKATAADLAALRAVNDELSRLPKETEADIRALRRVDFEFHRRMRATSDMPLLASTLQNLADRCEAYRARLLDHHLVYVPDAARHEPILAALVRGNAEEAGPLMRQHILEGMAVVLTELERA